MGRSFAVEADVVQHAFVDSLIRGMRARALRFDSLLGPTPRTSSRRPAFSDSALRIVSELEEEIRADSTELAAVQVKP